MTTNTAPATLTTHQARTLHQLIDGLNAWAHTEEGQEQVDALTRYAAEIFGPLELEQVTTTDAVLACPPDTELAADGDHYLYALNEGRGPIWIDTETGAEFGSFDLPLPARVIRWGSR